MVIRSRSFAADRGGAGGAAVSVDYGHEFLFSSSDETVRARAASLTAGPPEDGRVVGAIPFEASAPEALFVPDVWHHEPRAASFVSHGPVRDPRSFRVREVPCREVYTSTVRALLAALEAHARNETGLRKVVLARRLTVESEVEIDPVRLAADLQWDPRVTTIMFRFADSAVTRAMVAATPETLVDKRGDRVLSLPLAGSAPRRAEAVDDEAEGQRLLKSEKDLAEHRLVVEHILDLLAPHCASLDATAPELSATDTVWHLRTRVSGRLKDPSTPSITLARILHPTPAVCGVPTDAAFRLIRSMEPFRRGLYAGAVGWSDGEGGGRWMVTLRCAEIEGTHATLHAGAGIVRGSDPEAEWDETAMKFQAVLHALGVPHGAESPVPGP